MGFTSVQVQTLQQGTEVFYDLALISSPAPFLLLIQYPWLQAGDLLELYLNVLFPMLVPLPEPPPSLPT